MRILSHALSVDIVPYRPGPSLPRLNAQPCMPERGKWPARKHHEWRLKFTAVLKRVFVSDSLLLPQATELAIMHMHSI